MRRSILTLHVSLILIINLLLVPCIAQSQSQSPPPSPSDSCNGVYVSYSYTDGAKIPPFVKSTPLLQPYRFKSTLVVLNNGLEEVKSWMVYVGFQHGEYLVSASGGTLADGTNIPGDVSNGTVFSGYPNTDLKTAVETAGDLTQMQAQIDLVGTVFGISTPNMPRNITLANDGFLCRKSSMLGKNQMEVCCIKDTNATTKVIVADEFLPLQNGDLTIMYDVLRSYGSTYSAQVTIENQNSLGRLDDWHLSWKWMRGEFILDMRGAYPTIIDSSPCIFGEQAQYYANLDFSTILNCDRTPTIIDMPLTKANDTQYGLLPSCCRGGVLLPKWMDPSKSRSVFTMDVYKMPPDLNRSELYVPQSFQINGTLNPDYKCGAPVRVSPSEFPDPSGLPSNSTAIASWQVVCNITQPLGASPRCCVSFSSYYNDSIVPCETCACGCLKSDNPTCSTTSPAILLPPEAILVPFENRTSLALAWASLNHNTVPRPLPCGDNCGVSMNWHLYTDYNNGWSARITLFNWEGVSFADWFAAVEMGRAASGYEKLYSFNGSIVDGVKNTIFMQGLPGLNYLVAETNGTNAKDPMIPGKQQSVISFTKKGMSTVDVPGGDGFPRKVFFNGEECSIPSLLPTNRGRKERFSVRVIGLAFVVVVNVFVL